ncbi:dehydrin Xero 2-like [Pyrus communis]|uniref:dehydrin Xero 2-like n=1 Tax=Pyrus communis TaxID=23211 RepID=UPI0035C0FD4F
MAHYQNQYGATPQETDQFGNPIQHGTTGATGFGTGTTGYGTTNDPYTGGQQQQERGMMDKIKDKIPGTGGARRADDPYSSHAHTGTGTTGTGYGTTDAPYTGGEYRERGLMDKVKDKIPGTGGARRADDPYSSHAHTGTGTTGTGYGTTDAPYTGGEYRERGLMDKVKDKIPGTGGARRADDPYSSHAHTGTGTTGTGYGTTDAPYTRGEYRERGLMDKVKDKIPGTGGRTHDPTPYGGTTYTGERQHEGLVDKIPGTGHRDEAYSSHTTSTTAPYGGTTGVHHEKKGIMDKIKEKLPGGHR